MGGAMQPNWQNRTIPQLLFPHRFRDGQRSLQGYLWDTQRHRRSLARRGGRSRAERLRRHRRHRADARQGHEVVPHRDSRAAPGRLRRRLKPTDSLYLHCDPRQPLPQDAHGCRIRHKQFQERGRVVLHRPRVSRNASVQPQACRPYRYVRRGGFNTDAVRIPPQETEHQSSRGHDC